MDAVYFPAQYEFRALPNARSEREELMSGSDGGLGFLERVYKQLWVFFAPDGFKGARDVHIRREQPPQSLRERGGKCMRERKGERGREREREREKAHVFSDFNQRCHHIYPHGAVASFANAA